MDENTDRRGEATSPAGGSRGASPPNEGAAYTPTTAPPYAPGGSYGSPPPYGHGYSTALNPADERTWALLGHVGAFLLGFLAPLVVMLVQGPKSPYVRRHAVESLNFQITLMVAWVVGSVLAVVAAAVTFGLALFVFVPLAVAYGIFSVVVMILGSVKANNGEDYRYPLCARLVR